MTIPWKLPELSPIDEETLFANIIAIARPVARQLARRGAVDDLVQDVALSCLMKVREGVWNVSPDNLEAFVRGATRLWAADRWRLFVHSLERDAEHERELAESTRAWTRPDVFLESHELAALYERTLNTLPEVRRRVFLMVRDGERTYGDVAREVGVSRVTVKSHVVRAQRRLRTVLIEHGLDVRSMGKGQSLPAELRRGPSAWRRETRRVTVSR